MHKYIRHAIEGSVKKWENILAGTGLDKGVENCPLCKVFHSRTSKVFCEGCPVALKTGKRFCDDSPYEKWAYHQYDAHSHEYDGGMKCKECARLARVELKFLKRLLPKDEDD